jgi:biopolymer transport protein ExbB
MKISNKKIILSVLLFANFVFSSSAFAWWNEDWTFRKKLTIDTTAETGIDIKDSPQSVPVLVKLHSGNFGFFLDLKQDGSDLRFIASDDKTPLKFHVEKFDPVNEMALIWVQLPQLMGATNTEFMWMYYGNADAMNGEDKAGTYGVDQSLVYHFNKDGTAPKDVTAYNNKPNLFTAETIPASFIGAGAEFKGNGVISIPESPSLRMLPDSGWTASMWIKISEPQQDSYLLHRQDGNQSLVLGINGSAVYANYANNGKEYVTDLSNVTLGEWHHVACSLGSGQMTVFIDGLEVSKVPAPFAEMGGLISIGNDQRGGEHFLVGELDELSIAKVARTPAWLKSYVSSQLIDSKLLKYGEDEQSEGGGHGGSYLQILIQNVTVDGWVVIVLLGIMAAISWVVMLGKGFVVNSVRKDNQKFLERFRKLSMDDTERLDEGEKEEDKELEESPLAQALFGKHDHFQSSTIYQLYHTGIQQIHSRIGQAVGADTAGLSLQSIEAIRAAIDATLVRQSQRLNGQMVLLTIAISGGPFLGLLGTVVGVMITFAAIAATGDVNINAIAPGIAAALLATVAGLAVAIPALFGYNYLSSRIKEIVADMNVFQDEFITRVAEHYVREG